VHQEREMGRFGVWGMVRVIGWGLLDGEGLYDGSIAVARCVIAKFWRRGLSGEVCFGQTGVGVCGESNVG